MPQDWGRFWMRVNVQRESETLPTANSTAFDMETFRNEFGEQAANIMSKLHHDRAHREFDSGSARRYPGEVRQLRKFGIDVEALFEASDSPKGNLTV